MRGFVFEDTHTTSQAGKSWTLACALFALFHVYATAIQDIEVCVAMMAERPTASKRVDAILRRIFSI